MRRSVFILLSAALASAVQPASATSGTLDPKFSGDGVVRAFATGSVATAVAIDHAGRTVVVGYTVDDHVDVAVARFKPDGTFDPTFSGNGRVRMSLGAGAALAFDVAVAANDGLAIAGRWTGGGVEDSFVLRLGPDGEPVAAFGVDGLATVNFGKQESANAVSFAPSGAIDIGGYTSNGTTMRSALARLTPTGARDPSFSGDGKLLMDLSAGAEQVNDLVVLPHGDGELATTFGHGGMTRTDVGPGADIANAITMTGSGGFVLAGSAANAGHPAWGVIRYTPNGLPDPTFGAGGIVLLAWSGASDRADDVASSGARLLVAGRIHRAATGDDVGVVRLRANGTLDPTFARNGVARVDVDGTTNAAHGVALQPNGKIVAAGETWVAGVPRFLAVRLTA